MLEKTISFFKSVKEKLTKTSDTLTSSIVKVFKSKIKINEVVKEVKKILIDMQESLFNKASNFRNKNITLVDSFDDFNKVLNDKGGFISAHWDGTVETENLIKKKTKATIRCIPYNNKLEDGFCIYSGKPSIQRVLFAKAY